VGAVEEAPWFGDDGQSLRALCGRVAASERAVSDEAREDVPAYAEDFAHGDAPAPMVDWLGS